MESKQVNVYVSVGTTLGAAIITLVLRLLARRLTKVSIWFDDYLAIAASIAGYVWSAMVLWWVQVGLGLRLADIDAPQQRVLYQSRLILWVCELFYAFSLAFSKLSILSFYWRMFKTSSIKTPIKVLFGCALIWLILRTFMAIFHCVPVQGFWDKSISAIRAINDSKFFFGTVLTHLVIDIAILILPVVQVHRLQLPITQKIAISAMFMFGLFVCIASVVVLHESLMFDPSSVEVPWNITNIMVWATVEVNLAIVSSCLPMLRPIWTLFVKRVPLSHNSSRRDNYAHPTRDYDSTHLTTLNNKGMRKYDDTESIYPIAVSSTDGERSDSEAAAYDGSKGVSTVITAQRQSPDLVEDRAITELRGIVVQSEMDVKYSRPR